MEGRPGGALASSGRRGTHIVHFHADVDGLAEAVAAFVAEGLSDAQGAVLIVGSEHVRALEGALAAAGALVGDDDGASAGARVLVLDADDTLAHLLRDGSPDAALFEATIDPLLDEAEGPAGVRVYGEMVAHLWRADNVPGALELERQWNGLALRRPITLYCSYPSEIVSGGHLASALDAACRLHTDVVGETPIRDRSSTRRSFEPVAASVSDVRTFVATTLAEWGREALMPLAALVASELATNAVLHARTPFSVTVAPLGDVVRVGVSDGERTTGVVRVARPGETSGRGLLIVRGLCETFGVEPRADGKTVWAELRAAA